MSAVLKQAVPDKEATLKALDSGALAARAGIDSTSNITESARAMYELTLAYTVDSPEMFEYAASEAKAAKAQLKRLTEERFSATRPLDASKAVIMAWFKPAQDYLEKAVLGHESKMLAYNREQARLKAEAEATARTKARAEQTRLDKEADARAAQACASGNLDEAREILESVPTVPVAVVTVDVAPKVSGISARTNWKHRITDASLIPREYLIPNDQMLGAMARSTKNSVQIPGVEFYSTEGLAIGSK